MKPILSKFTELFKAGYESLQAYYSNASNDPMYGLRLHKPTNEMLLKNDKYHDFNSQVANDPNFYDETHIDEEDMVEHARRYLTIFEDDFGSASKKLKEEFTELKQLVKQAHKGSNLGYEIGSRENHIDDLLKCLEPASAEYNECVHYFNKYLELTGREQYQRKELVVPTFVRNLPWVLEGLNTVLQETLHLWGLF